MYFMVAFGYLLLGAAASLVLPMPYRASVICRGAPRQLPSPAKVFFSLLLAIGAMACHLDRRPRLASSIIAASAWSLLTVGLISAGIIIVMVLRNRTVGLRGVTVCGTTSFALGAILMALALLV
jgi:hypothetical protein